MYKGIKSYNQNQSIIEMENCDLLSKFFWRTLKLLLKLENLFWINRQVVKTVGMILGIFGGFFLVFAILSHNYALAEITTDCPVFGLFYWDDSFVFQKREKINIREVRFDLSLFPKHHLKTQLHQFLFFNLGENISRQI